MEARSKPGYNEDASGDADPLLAMDRKVSPLKPSADASATQRLITAENRVHALQRQLKQLTDKSLKLQAYETDLSQVLHAVFRGARALTEPSPDDDSPDAQWIRKVISSTTFDRPLGAMIDVLIQRSDTGNTNTVLPESIIHFGLGLLSSSPSQYRLLRAAIGPGVLPAEETLRRHRDKVTSASDTHSSSEKYLARLRAAADALGVAGRVREEGWLLNDEMNIKPGLTYNRKTCEYDGFVTTSVFDLALQINAVDTADAYSVLCPELASHVSIWYYASTDKALNMPVMNVFTKANSRVKPFDMVAQVLDLLGRLRLQGFGVSYICTDSAPTNIVSKQM